MIYTFHGETKGKTSSALGTVLRALGAKKRVRIVFFMKHWNTSEAQFLRAVRNQFDVDFYQSGNKEFIYMKDVNHATLRQAQSKLQFGEIKQRDVSDIEQAQRGLKKARAYLAEKPFLLVLDELNYAVMFGLIQPEEARELLERANEQETHVILTGKELHPTIAAMSDLITEMKKIKHPFDKGIYGIKGLDY